MVFPLHTESISVHCEDEPIHIPGAIQPFGILISIELPSLRIGNASTNCGQAFGVDAPVLVQTSLAEYLSCDALNDLRQYLVSENMFEAVPLTVRLRHIGTAVEKEWVLTAHYSQGALIVELEPLPMVAADPNIMHRIIRYAVQSIFRTASVADLCNETTRLIREITGYDRVMIYRFSDHWDGHVVAEARADHVHSYFDHHFPASDIPAQARAIFLTNWLRMIPDVGYRAVPVFPSRSLTTGAPLDLGLSAVRSVSSLHIEYLKNMQVGATVTFPLIDEGKLWGLIACHHQTANTLNFEQRLGGKMLAQLVSSQLALKESIEEQRYGAQLRRIYGQLVENMETEEDLVYGLVKDSPTMLDLAGASGGAIAIYHNNDWTIIGNTPTVSQIEELVDWLATVQSRNGLYSTNQLGNVFAPALKYKAVASGLLAISIPKSVRNYILWFKPEVVATITWAGEPEKRIKMDGDVVKLHPRFSFDSWKQVVNGMATPWKKIELDVVLELRASILAIDLQRAFKQEQAARAMAEQASQEKQNMVHTVSHDIRNPLNVIKMTLQMLQLNPAVTATALAQLTTRGLRATDSIERLVTSVLDRAKSEHVNMKNEYRPESLKSLIHDAVDLALPLAERNGISIIALFDAKDSMVLCQRVRVEQILGNLISNALKFTPFAGRITVAMKSGVGEALVSVADTGVGISSHLLPRVFDRFVQGNVRAELGAGLGLSIVKDIVEHDGGRIWVESAINEGTTFYFTLSSVLA